MTLFSKVESNLAARHPASAKGHVNIRFALSPNGRTYLAEQYAQYPFHICRPQYVDADYPDLATLYIQSCSGGIYESDHLQMRLQASTGTASHVTTQSSTVVHSMPVGSAQQDVFIEAEEGAYIEFLPDPQVLFPESRFSSLIRVQKARGSTTLVADAFLVHDPSSSDACFSTYASEIQVVSESGEALAIDRQKIEGSLFARHWPGITGHFSAQGSLVIVSDRPSDDLQDRLQIIDVEGAVIGASALPSSCGLFTRILAKDGISLRSAMHAIWSTVRTEIKGAAPRPRRK